MSGLALGIDTSAHEGALSDGCRTLAVLDSGLRAIHPRSNVELAERVAQSCALVSEMPPNAPPRGHQLMARDRIISGLSKAVIAIEAIARSGSLDTAQCARKQSRTVFAVEVGSEGTPALISTGALSIPTSGIDFNGLGDQIAALSIHPPKPSSKPEQLGILFG